ncbi:MAG: hypothetical protein KA341_01645 [Saprospiraceae bacterium]|nr:hypothetical protein [Saprospiraceae bacterium]
MESNIKPIISYTDIQNDLSNIDQELNQPESSTPDVLLDKILDTKCKLRTRKSSNITFSGPFLLQNDNPVFYPHTINVIQGQAGVHKSRLAETICSAILKKEFFEKELLGFQAVSKFSILYVDTERNLTEQLPFALQSIQMKAGYNKEDHPSDFDYISLLEINRKERFNVLNKYLSHYRTIYADRPTFIVLDVSTDCIEDFNKSDKSMELIDHMNLAINEYNVVFLCLIHENPGSEKARGHFGTELINKSSTVMRVDFEKDNNGRTDVIQVKYLKCRSTARHEPFYIKYSDEEKGLVLVDNDSVDVIKMNRQQTAKLSDIIEYITINFAPKTEMPKMDLIEDIAKYIGGSERTIENRLSEIVKKEIQFISAMDGNSYKLIRPRNGKTTYYTLQLLK